MKTFILILLFGKTILLTEDPITVVHQKVIVPNQPLTAITSGASLGIDISSHIDESQVFEARDKAMELFPSGSITATLVRKDSKEVELVHKGIAVSNESIALTLSSIDGVPTKVEFVKVILKSKVKLEEVTVYWKNYKH